MTIYQVLVELSYEFHIKKTGFYFDFGFGIGCNANFKYSDSEHSYYNDTYCKSVV